MKPQMLFWFAHVKVGGRSVALAVAAVTEKQARFWIKRRVGAKAVIDYLSPIGYAHAWVLDLNCPN